MRIIVSLIASMFLVGCSKSHVDTNKEGARLMEISREWSKSAATDDIERILSYWADDAVMMSSTNPPLKGKAAIREMVEATKKIPGFKISWEPVNVAVSSSGDMAYMIEENQVTVNDSLGNPVTKYGTGVTIWRKEKDGIWRNVVEIVNDKPVQENE
jgi:uncharacterized protein (TIGR02246 family)